MAETKKPSPRNTCPVRGVVFRVPCGNGNRHRVVLTARGHLRLADHPDPADRAAERVAAALAPDRPNCLRALAVWAAADPDTGADEGLRGAATYAMALWRWRAAEGWFARMKLAARWRKVLGTADGPHAAGWLPAGTPTAGARALLETLLRARYDLRLSWHYADHAHALYVCRPLRPGWRSGSRRTDKPVELRCAFRAKGKTVYWTWGWNDAGGSGRAADQCLDCAAAWVAGEWLCGRRDWLAYTRARESIERR